ncbi:MAG TPA: histidine--tRNA ligase, partial [Desulfobacteraceae bacterium]|nr:histidine--tRNA ligase [Desulfobacteraceae bacterium]
NRFMVRGLDYYTRTTFEFVTGDLGAQAAIGAGGRYDGLIEQLGGPKLPGIGFAMGMERLVLLLQAADNRAERPGPSLDLFVAALGSRACLHGYRLVHGLRQRGLRAAMDYSGRSLKAQMKQAARQAARHTLILGDDELERQTAILRNMQTQEQLPFPLQADVGQECLQLIDIIQTT